MGKLKTLRKGITWLVVACLLFPSALFLASCGKGLELTITSEKGLSIKPGESTQLTLTLKNEAEDDKVEDATYSVIFGEGYATVSGTGLLTVSASAKVGDKVRVVAKLKGTSSNTLEITVDRILATSIALTAKNGQDTIMPSGFAELVATVTPTNATEAVEFVLVEGTEFAHIENKRIFVDAGTEMGETIKVKAVSGEVESNELTFVVASSPTSEFRIVLNDTMTVDKYGTGSNVLTATVYDASLNVLDDQPVSFQIERGEQFVDIDNDNTDNTCTIDVTGHGTAVIRGTLANGQYATTTVTTIMPPSDLDLNEMLAVRQDIDYTVGKTGGKNAPFAFDVVKHGGDLVCQDVVYTFAKKDGSSFVPQTDNEVAEYDNTTKKITFKQTGTIRVTATSNSGSRKEATVSQDFIVNDGINVSTFLELQKALPLDKTDSRVVNIVVTESLGLVEEHNNALYNNYEIVPVKSTGIGVPDWRGIVTRGDVTINGNNHKFNLTQMPRESNYFGNELNALIRIEPNGSTPYEVEFNDLIIEGSLNPMLPYDDITGSSPKFYFYKRYLHIGKERNPETNSDFDSPLHGNVAPCFLTMDNVDLSGGNTGMRLAHLVSSEISNTRIADIWNNGIELISSIVTLKNMTYGLCGTAPLEVGPEFSANAGVDFDQKQSVKFAGTLDCTNAINGTTAYYQILESMNAFEGHSFSSFLHGGLTGLSYYQMSNVLHPTNEFDETYEPNQAPQTDSYFQLVALVFQNPTYDPNISEFVPGGVSNSIGNLTETPTNAVDTTHQYLRFNLPGIGEVLVKNWNFVPTT